MQKEELKFNAIYNLKKNISFSILRYKLLWIEKGMLKTVFCTRNIMPQHDSVAQIIMYRLNKLSDRQIDKSVLQDQ